MEWWRWGQGEWRLEWAGWANGLLDLPEWKNHSCFMTVPLIWSMRLRMPPCSCLNVLLLITRKHGFSSEATCTQPWCTLFQASVARRWQLACSMLACPRGSELPSCQMRPDVHGWVWYSRSFCPAIKNSIKSEWWLRMLFISNSYLSALCTIVDHYHPDKQGGRWNSAWLEAQTCQQKQPKIYSKEPYIELVWVRSGHSWTQLK